MLQLEYFKLKEDAFDLVKAHDSDAGWDLRSREDVFIPLGSTMKVSTGIAIKIPEEFYGQVADRSSMASKGLKVGGGVIDALYNGEISVILHNLTNKDVNQPGTWASGYQIKKGDKIAQIIPLRCGQATVTETKELWSSQRGNKGFGSSGR